jgi:hypothetical protein
VFALCVSGFLGSFFHPQHPASRVDIMDPIQEHDLRIDRECRQPGFLDAVRCVRRIQRQPLAPFFTVRSDAPLEVTLEVSSFPREMADYLARAERGELRLLTFPFFLFQYPYQYEAYIPGAPGKLELAKEMKFAFDSAQVADFARRKRLTFKTMVPDGETLDITSRKLQIRNAEPLDWRRDSIRFDGRPFTLPRGENLLVVFYFETLDHVPQAIFY